MSGIKKTVEIVPFAPPVRGRVRNRVSDFFVTMNTNKRIDGNLTPESPLVTVLENAGASLFGDEEHFTKFVKFPKGGSWNSDNIVALEVVTGVDVGKDDAHGQRLHLHAQFKVTHKSFVKLDFRELQDEMNSILAARGYPLRIHYTHVSFHKADMSREYIEKNREFGAKNIKVV